MTGGMSDRQRWSELLPRVISSIDVDALVGELVAVRRVGRTLVGCCPFHEDQTPSLNVFLDTGKFFCFGCQEKGDILDLAGHFWGVSGFRNQLVAVARWGGLAWALDRLEGRGGPQANAPISKPISRPRARKPVDRAEVAALWSQCLPVMDSPAVSEYLRNRRLDPIEIADRDLARALPKGLTLPEWASFQRVAWNRSQHLLVARLFDSQGRLASMTARRTIDSDEMPKALFPPGPRAGFLLADDAGQWVLRAPHDYLPDEVWIAEGVTDCFSLACDFSFDQESAPGVLSIVGPSSWSKAVADRIPDRVVVVVTVDPDGPGEKYFAEIIKSFEHRPVCIDRWTPKREREDA